MFRLGDFFIDGDIYIWFLSSICTSCALELMRLTNYLPPCFCYSRYKQKYCFKKIDEILVFWKMWKSVWYIEKRESSHLD